MLIDFNCNVSLSGKLYNNYIIWGCYAAQVQRVD